MILVGANLPQPFGPHQFLKFSVMIEEAHTRWLAIGLGPGASGPDAIKFY